MKSFTMDQRRTSSRMSKEALMMTAKRKRVSLELRQRDQPQTIYICNAGQRVCRLDKMRTEVSQPGLNRHQCSS
jgi:hypothetical protein